MVLRSVVGRNLMSGYFVVDGASILTDRRGPHKEAAMNQHQDDSTNPSGTPTAGVRSQRPTRTRYWVLAALCLAALVAYVQRNSIGVAEPEIRSQLHLNKYEMGWVISGFFLTYAAFQLPTGYLAKRLGTRRALPIFALLFSAAAGVFALARGLSETESGVMTRFPKMFSIIAIHSFKYFNFSTPKR